MDLPALRRLKIPISASVTELQRDCKRVLDYVQRERHPLLILRHIEAQGVIIDTETWHEIMQWIEDHISSEERDQLYRK